MIRKDKTGNVSAIIPVDFAYSDREVIRYAMETFGFLLARNETVTYREFATMIRQIYDNEMADYVARVLEEL